TPLTPACATPFPYTTLFRSAAPAPGRDADLVLREPARLAPPRRGHAGPLRPPEHEPARGDLLELRRLPAGRGTGHALHRPAAVRSEEHTSELQSRSDLVCRL